jgi:hypothetical protein
MTSSTQSGELWPTALVRATAAVVALKARFDEEAERRRLRGMGRYHPPVMPPVVFAQYFLRGLEGCDRALGYFSPPIPMRA